jgi:hypothetical protein
LGSFHPALTEAGMLEHASSLHQSYVRLKTHGYAMETHAALRLFRCANLLARQIALQSRQGERRGQERRRIGVRANRIATQASSQSATSGGMISRPAAQERASRSEHCRIGASPR